MPQCVSAWEFCQAFCLRNLQGEAERQESTAEDNLLYFRCGHQNPNLVQGFHPERTEEGDRHGMMLAYTGVCLQWSGTTNPQCLKRPGATKLEFKGEHQPCSFPPQMRGILNPMRFMLLSAASCGRQGAAQDCSWQVCSPKNSIRSSVWRGLERLLPETLSSQPSLPTETPICHQAGQPFSAMLLLPFLPTLSWRWKWEQREVGKKGWRRQQPHTKQGWFSKENK